MNDAILAYLDLIEAIVAAMDARDTYTASHSERVADLSELICRFVGLSQKEEEIVHIASHVHDIGKIGVPDSVLLKSQSLTEDEWELMKSHTEIGYRILEKVSGFKEVALIVRFHHEQWNGKGYPLGLVGNKIPYGSRIIAIADSIDAMLSDRKYRKSLTIPQCKYELEKNCGIMYDPEILRAVLNQWSAFEEFMSRSKDLGDNRFCLYSPY